MCSVLCVLSRDASTVTEHTTPPAEETNDGNDRDKDEDQPDTSNEDTAAQTPSAAETCQGFSRDSTPLLTWDSLERVRRKLNFDICPKVGVVHAVRHPAVVTALQGTTGGVNSAVWSDQVFGV